MKQILTSISVGVIIFSLFLIPLSDANCLTNQFSPTNTVGSQNINLRSTTNDLFVRDTNLNLTHSVVMPPILKSESNGSFTVQQRTSLESSNPVWWIIDVWGTPSGDDFPQYMIGTFTAVENTFSNLDSNNNDYVIYEPINVAYGSSESYCVWFQFCVYFFSDGSVGMNIWAMWAFNGGGWVDDVISNSLPYTPGHTYNFALTTSGTNTVSFNIEDINTFESWSNSDWGVTVPGLTIQNWPWPGYYSPASCVEGCTTNSPLTDVPNFQTTLGYGETRYYHSESSGVPSGIYTCALPASANYYDWSMTPTTCYSLTVNAYDAYLGEYYPYDVNVYLDNNWVGTTPLELQVPIGDHLLSVDATVAYSPYWSAWDVPFYDFTGDFSGWNPDGSSTMIGMYADSTVNAQYTQWFQLMQNKQNLLTFLF